MEALVLKLTQANEAYRNGSSLLMTDDEYDAALEQLRALNPKHPFLKKVRAKPSEKGKTVQMPYYLGSLDKAKTQEELEKWTKKHSDNFIVSEKLDGISGLWNPFKKQLYLSGDDNTGLDVSAWLKYISLSPSKLSSDIPETVWIRGELIMPRKSVPEGKLGRSIVNGIFHHHQPNPSEAAKVRFVAYELIGMDPNLSVQQQFSWLQMWNMWLPWYYFQAQVSSGAILSNHLSLRRNDSEYDMDGLVIKTNVPFVPRITKGNPKDAIAWKPPNGESRVARVLNLEWNASASGKLVPRVQIEPIQLGGSTIQFVTGVNARRIVDWKIGVGAEVIIRKGGDVIPLIESVQKTAIVTFPPEGTWEWDGNPDVAVNIKQTSADSTTIVSQMMKLVKQLDWPNIGPAVMKTVVEAGYSSVPLLRSASEDTFKKLLGPVKGSNLYRLVQTDGWSNASEIDLFLASPLRQDGIGSTKLEVLYTVEPDVRKWSSTNLAPKGWSPDSLKEFQSLWAKYEVFRKTEWNFLPYPLQKKVITESAIQIKGSVVFTGFRDSSLESELLKKGFKLSDTVKSDTKAVFITDNEDPKTYTSTKIDKAKKLPGCLILRKSDYKSLV